MNSNYDAVIGLEIHAQLLTDTKLFTSCSNQFGSSENTNIDPLSIGLPGTLPVLNKDAVSLAIKAAIALECDIQQESVFSRKNYFYPDLPKGYQISQYDRPYALGGKLRFVLNEEECSVNLTRIHMEEDAGKSIHDNQAKISKVDYNRAGCPLIEIVSEPEISSGEEAAACLKFLRNTLVSIGVNDGNLEQGSFRFDANVSVKPKGQKELGTKVELKNLNSFRFVAKAIDYEIDRQIRVIEDGGTITQQSRLYNAEKSRTEFMRGKEFAEDYRYFPDPDIPILRISPNLIENQKEGLSPTPFSNYQRLRADLNSYDSENIISDSRLIAIYDKLVELGNNPKKAANWILGEYSRLLNSGQDISKLSPEKLSDIIKLAESGKTSAKNAKILVELVCDTGKDPAELMREKGLEIVQDNGQIEATLKEIIASNQGQADQYRAGKVKLKGFFVGQVMKAMKGKADAKTVSEIFEKLINA